MVATILAFFFLGGAGGSGVTPTYGSPDEFLTLTTWSDPDPSLTTTEAYDPAADDGVADASLTLTTWE